MGLGPQRDCRRTAPVEGAPAGEALRRRALLPPPAVNKVEVLTGEKADGEQGGGAPAEHRLRTGEKADGGNKVEVLRQKREVLLRQTGVLRQTRRRRIFLRW